MLQIKRWDCPPDPSKPAYQVCGLVRIFVEQNVRGRKSFFILGMAYVYGGKFANSRYKMTETLKPLETKKDTLTLVFKIRLISIFQRCNVFEYVFFKAFKTGDNDINVISNIDSLGPNLMSLSLKQTFSYHFLALSSTILRAFCPTPKKISMILNI